MASRKVIVESAVGLHARPATIFVKAVNDAGLPVQVGRPGGKLVNAGSILLVMSLGVKCGEEVELVAEGDGADAQLDHLADLLSRDLDA
ncbi:MAG: HPr family phosphocarrier protein [Propionibacteriaceae bacterium]|jgi:phosphocarrier protein|nr:HPr family phosphocarrier protein [Propionibacteriaceae bacterium]